MLGILTINWKPRLLCLMEEGSKGEASWVPGEEGWGGVCRIEFPGLQSSDFNKSFAILKEAGWTSNCLTLGAVIVNFLALELAWPINAPSLFSIPAVMALERSFSS